MDTTLIAAIAAAALVLGLLLLRKSSQKGAETKPDVTSDQETEAAVQEDTDFGEPETGLKQAAGEEEPEIGPDLEDEETVAGEEALAVLDEDAPVAIDGGDDEPAGEQAATTVDQDEPEPAEAQSSVDENESFADLDEVEERPDTEEAEEAAGEVEEVEAAEAEVEEEAPPCAIPALTIEIYETRLREREAQQQEVLSRAIAEQDNITRDHVQIELVAVTDRIALLEDSYKEEMQWRQAALDALQAIAPDEDEDTIKSLQEELSSGETVQAEKLFRQVADRKGKNAALAAFHGGRLAEARVDLYQALARYQQAVELDGNNSEYLKAAGVMARKLYRYRDARPLLEKLVDLLSAQDSDSIELALARRELGYTYALSGALKQAGPLYKQAMKTIAKQLGQEHLEMGISWSQIAELQEAKGQYDQAAPTYSKALAILEKELGPEHPALDHILEKLAGLNAELEEDEKAAALYERLCAVREKSLGATHPKLAMALQNLAEAYRLQGQYEAAEQNYNKALAIMEANHGKDHPAVAAILQELAKLCFRQKKNDEGEALQKRATEIFEKSIQGQEDDITEDALNLQDKE